MLSACSIKVCLDLRVVAVLTEMLIVFLLNIYYWSNSNYIDQNADEYLPREEHLVTGDGDRDSGVIYCNY